jgi:4-hydroxy-4-methyl-2-oxoglutarate aldolase
MIDDAPLLTIKRHFDRPSRAEVAAFAGVMTGFVADALGGRGAMVPAVKPIAGTGPFCGVAVPCAAGPADNLAVFGALLIAEPGDVVVCAADGFEHTAVTGDLLLGMLQNKGCVGFVTDGAVRDLPGIRDVGLPCYATAVTPNSPAKSGPGTVGLPVVVGGVTVGPGDIVLGDEDGVVVVPKALIARTIERLDAVKAAEATMLAKVQGGMTLPDSIKAMADAGRFLEVE